jgi:hypothetical protein
MPQVLCCPLRGKIARRKGGTKASIKRGYRRGKPHRYALREQFMGPAQDNGPMSQFLAQFRGGRTKA